MTSPRAAAPPAPESLAPIRHQVILASAGSGKTFQLSNRFLALLARGVPPERILATTFTRKAAGEILARVLGRLAEAAAEPARLEALVGQLEGATLDGPGCVHLLARTLRSLDRFNVRTLDAFFAQLAALFGLDVGLAPGWGIGEQHDDARLAGQAVGRVLGEAAPDEMIALLRELTRSQAARSVHERVVRIARDMHGVWRESTPEAWEAIRPPAALADAALQAAIAAVRDLPLPLTKAKGKQPPRPHSAWAGARNRIVELAEAGDWEGVLEAGLLKSAATGEPMFSRVAIDPDARARLAPLARHAMHDVLSRLALMARADRRLLERFDVALAACRREARLYAFDDLPRALLAEGRPDGPVAPGGWADGSAFHRLDGALEHILLDEFQDTSALQYRALAPLIESIVRCRDGRRTLFCVGDGKQSIYGWRDGEPRLLAGFAERHGLQATTLAENHRSSAIVLGAVNAVFSRLRRSPTLAAEAPLAAAAACFADQFQEHTASKSLPGCVTLREVEGAEREVLAAASEHVRALSLQAPWCSIAVLVRSNRVATQLLWRLRTLDVRASGEGGNPLIDSEAVQLVLSLLHLADHPADSAVLFHVTTSALGAHLGLPAATGDRTAAALAAAAAVAARVRSELLARGYGAWLASLQPWVDGASGFDAWDRRRFAQLVDLGFAWDRRASLRPAEFVAMVREQRVEDPLGARVSVMTVHKAKGLEFDAVVLPDLDGALIGKRPPALMARRQDPAGPITEVFPSVKQSLAPFHEPVSLLFDAVRQRRVEEELCVLYVAMTRAARRLDLIVKAVPSDKRPATPATLLREALADPSAAAPAAPAGDVLHATSSAKAWFADAPAGAASEGPASAVPAATGPAAKAGAATVSVTASNSAALAFAPSRRDRFLPRRAPSSREGGRLVSLARVLEAGSSAARGRGSLVHRWLAEVEWLADFERSAAAGDPHLLELGRRLVREQDLPFDEARLREELARFREALARPATRALLERPSAPAGPDGPAGGVDVWRERPFAVRSSDAEGHAILLHGAFDRVVLQRAGDRWRAATIVDFKTDRAGAAELAARAAHYRPQLAEYRRALAALTGLPAAAIRCTLLFLQADATVDVPPGGDE